MKVRPAQLVLQCYAERDNDSWFVICLELNLYARADIFEDARNKLHEAVKCYITEALTEDAEYIDQLIPRKAPMYFWAKYYLVKFLIGCHLTIDAAKKRLFKERLALLPA